MCLWLHFPIYFSLSLYYMYYFCSKSAYCIGCDYVTHKTSSFTLMSLKMPYFPHIQYRCLVILELRLQQRTFILLFLYSKCIQTAVCQSVPIICMQPSPFIKVKSGKWSKLYFISKTILPLTWRDYFKLKHNLHQHNFFFKVLRQCTSKFMVHLYSIVYVDLRPLL